ncbi:PorT family protein [Hymenobacter sp. BT683]|uniref:PorT family protein n=1 Tax=Hymenobacter jeongseonensis TaxID=2791027 RepID=A0ABS0IEI6_9BACT|nr:outer membrane beta-barrel protein [Hymenobacter jeongseonensis]MBF9236725.1 PorT family protein [Hymenobacter jeongseonensis]
MKLLTTSVLAIVLSAATASAQPSFKLGLRGSVNRATTTLDPANTGTRFSNFSYSADKSAIYAWQAGAVLEIAFDRFALQPTLLFSQKGEQFDAATSMSGVAGVSGSNTHSTNRYNWLELPVNVVYSISNFQLFGGPYAALGIGGRRRGTTLNYSPFVKFAPLHFNEKIRYGSDTDNSRVDAGVNVGIGYRRGPAQLQVAYQLGLVNLHSSEPSLLYDYGHDFARDAAYNRGIQLTGTYFFAL